MADADHASEGAFRERLLSLAAGHALSLTDPQLADLARYFTLLRKWNRTINLTALPLEDSPPDRTFLRLFIEPLQAAPFVAEGPLEWFDLGSGGGSPGVPLKIVRPRARLTMVESKLRKAAFLREAAGSLSLDSTRVLPVRVEDLEGHADPGSLDLLTTRGLRLDREMIRVAASLLRPGGRCLVFGSKAWPAGDRTFDPIERVVLAGGESILQILGKPG